MPNPHEAEWPKFLGESGWLVRATYSNRRNSQKSGRLLDAPTPARRSTKILPCPHGRNHAPKAEPNGQLFSRISGRN
jgi:hypothetical protein